MAGNTEPPCLAVKLLSYALHLGVRKINYHPTSLFSHPKVGSWLFQCSLLVRGHSPSWGKGTHLRTGVEAYLGLAVTDLHGHTQGQPSDTQVLPRGSGKSWVGS